MLSWGLSAAISRVLVHLCIWCGRSGRRIVWSYVGIHRMVSAEHLKVLWCHNYFLQFRNSFGYTVEELKKPERWTIFTGRWEFVVAKTTYLLLYQIRQKPPKSHGPWCADSVCVLLLSQPLLLLCPLLSRDTQHPGSGTGERYVHERNDIVTISETLSQCEADGCN